MTIENTFKNQSIANSYGLAIQKVAWEDTSRTKGSCIGLSISDLTLNVNGKNQSIIRKPNFADITADVPESNFMVTIGNESSRSCDLTRIPLKDYLNSLKPDLFLERDSMILTSAQCCVLPLSAQGEVEFCGKMYNYQAAVLVVVSTSQGTSSLILSGNDFLYFNRGGRITKFLAKRLSQDRRERKVSLEGEMTTEEADRNVILIYQIPLKRKGVNRDGLGSTGAFFLSGGNSKTINNYKGLGKVDEVEGCEEYEESDEEMGFGCTPQSTFYRGCQKKKTKNAGSRGMENAMLRSSDKDLGPFPTLNKEKLVRDERFPIRCTFQFYRVSDSDDLTESDIQYISEKIDSVYKLASAVGSLVIGNSSAGRITETTPLKKLSLSSNLPPLFKYSVV